MPNPLRRLPNSSVRLEHFWIERFNIDLGDAPVLGEDMPEPNIRYSVTVFEIETDPDLYRVRLRLRSEPSGGNLEDRHFDLVLSGVFYIPGEEFSLSDRQPFLDLNAPAILYGIARGLIASVSGAGSPDSLQLPSADFAQAAIPK